MTQSALNKNTSSKIEKKFWLMKSEPEVFSISTLKKSKSTLWEGVRNYQARNYMMNEMQPGDLVLFYHSSCEIPGVYGFAKVSSKATPDPTQFNKKSEYYDAKATKEKPTWFCVEITFVSEFKKPLSLNEIKEDTNLKDMLVIRKGQRLSIQPVSFNDFNYIQQLVNK